MIPASGSGRPMGLTVTAVMLAAAALLPLRLFAFGEAVLQGGAQETVQIALPPSVTFYVTNLSASTQAANASVITFSNAQLRRGRSLGISVRAESVRFVAPFGPAIDIGGVSWRTTNVVNGRGLSGTLRRSDQDVFESQSGALSGSVTVEWTLAPPPAGVAAGAHTVTLRWRLRSVNP